MFDLLFSQRGVAFGAGYADVHAQLPVLKALVVLAGLVAVLCLVTIRLRSWRPLLWSVAALVGVAILGGVVYPGVIQRYQVSPNEIVKEKPYIDFNIRYTRLAYGLDNIEEREFPAEQTLTLQDLRKNEATIKNIRLWDTRPLLATYSQLQEIRTYYKFTDIDIDRYRINGEYRQVTLSAAGALREGSAEPDLDQRAVDVYARLRRRRQSGESGDARGAPRVLGQGHPPRGLQRSPDLPPGALLQRTGHGLCLREDPGQGIRLPGGGPERLHHLRGAGRHPAGILLAQGAVRGAPGGPQAPPVQRPDPRKPGANLPEHPGASPADRPVLPVRRRSVHGDLGRGAHRLAPGWLHGLRPVPVLGADARAGQLRAQRRQSDRGRLRRDGALLCGGSGGSPDPHDRADLPRAAPAA